MPTRTKITIITVPPARSVDDLVYVHRDGREEIVPHDPTLWNKDCIYFPREWSKDPDLDDYDYDEEDAIEVRPAGAVVAWLKEQGFAHKSEQGGPYLATTPILTVEQESEFRVKWI